VIQGVNGSRRVLCLILTILACIGLAAASWLHFKGEVGLARLSDASPFKAVYVLPDNDLSNATITLIYPSGETNNPYAEGLAHYVEHLAWQNVRDAGADGGRHSNAWTSSYATAYWLSRPPSELAATIQRLAATADPLVATRTEALQERDIVQREYDYRVGEERWEPLWAETREVLYRDTPFERSIIGTRESIESFMLEQAQQLHKRSHHLNQATLLVRGPLRVSDVENALATLNVNATPRADWLPAPTNGPAMPTAEDVATRTISGIGTSLVVQQRYVPRPDGLMDAEYEVRSYALSDLLDSTKAGGIARPLRYDEFIARNFSLGLPNVGTVGFELWIVAEPDIGVTLDQLRTAITQTLDASLTNLDRGSFDEWKAEVIDDFEDKDAEELAEFDYDEVISALSEGRPYVSYASYIAALRKTTLEDVATFAGRFVTEASIVTRQVINE